MMDVNLDDLQLMQDALRDVVGYLTDNSCCDPDCCGGPFYEYEQFVEGTNILSKFGLVYNQDRKRHLI